MAPDTQTPAGESHFRKVEKRFNLGGAPIEVIVGLSAASIELTDFLTVTVRAEHGESVTLEPPYLSESVYAPLVLVQSPREDLYWSEKQGRIIKTWTYRFEPMRSGDFHLKPFRVFFRLNAEKQPKPEQWPVYKIETDNIPYKVTSVELGDQPDIRDIKDLILPAYDYRPLAVTSTVIGVISLMLWVGYGIRQRYRKLDLPLEMVIDYLSESLRRLDDLEAKDYISRQQHERLHVELSAILRYYIENRFGLRAREQTTEEFIREIRYDPHFATEQQAILQQFLGLADLVKFATYDPGSDASRDAMNTVRYFIESTRKTNED
jgi:hypothetical protein